MTLRLLKIALDVTCLTDPCPTGVSLAALYQLQALFARQDGFDFRLFAARGRRWSGHLYGLEAACSRTVILPFARSLRLFLWQRMNWPPIEWFCGEVDIAHEFFHQAPAARRAIRLVTIHDLSFYRRPDTHTPATVKTQDALMQRCVQHAHYLVAVSESCKQDLMELLRVPAERVFVAPDGVDMQEFSGPVDGDALAELKKRLHIDRPYYIHVGTVEPRKNIARLLTAYSHLAEQRPDCPQLVLVGKPGWLCEPILARIAAMASTGRIIYTGYLDRANTVLLLRGALACVYPSLYEGFGMPVLEAMAGKVPVITSNISALPWVVGDTGLLVDPESVDAIEAALHNVLDCPDAACTRAEAAYRRARLFTWDRSAEALARIYRTVAENR